VEQALFIAVGLSNEWFEPTQVILAAEVTNRVTVSGRIAAKQFDNVGF
jgi:hypothetical protein